MSSSFDAGGVSRKSALVLAAALTVALAIGLGSVAESSAGGTHAVAAKKKCKKGKKSAVAAKKKCKKKGAGQGPVAIPSPPPPAPNPTTRATLTWNNGSDLDLYVFDTSGIGGYGADGIPSTSFPTDDTDGFGPEQFIDQLSPSTRVFSYCIVQLDNDLGTLATLLHVLSNGTSVTFNTSAGALDNSGDAVEVVPPGGFDPGDPGQDNCGF